VNNVKSGPFGSVLVDSPPGSLVLAEPLLLVSAEGDVEGCALLVSPPGEPIEEAEELAPPELASPEPGARVTTQASADMTSPAANKPTTITDFLGIHHLLRQFLDRYPASSSL
jgi:hypothetical protein